MGNFIFGGGSKPLNKGRLLTYRGSKALPLSFTLQPQAKTVDEYAPATFSCEVTGGVAPYSYQWKKNGTNVGTNSAALSFTATAADKNASITVVVTDSAGAVITSTSAVLGVTSYVYQFDGLTQYLQLSSLITLPVSASFEVEITYSNLTGGYIFAHSTSVDATLGRYVMIGSDSYGYISSSSSSIPPSSLWVKRVSNVISAKNTASTSLISSEISIDRVLGKFAGTTSLPLGGGRVSRFRVWIGGDRTSGSLFSDIYFNNKSQGANQLATVGSINATIVNYNANGWVAI